MSCWDFPRHHARLSLPLTSAGGLSINTSLLSPTATAHQLCPADIRMKLLTGLIFCSLVLGVSSWLSFLGEAFQGMDRVFRLMFLWPFPSRGWGHVESLLRHERGQLERLRQILPCSGEL
ncbi:uncharacterized protein LOC110543558 isoform X3 [Meriones unguiculatus]|uniref:uncharacterized protein LOC110543558 isoform X3 n=1 Tax=Meriones unguiculatus TaxID=10047 RepID=UPI00293EDE0E|nr:uncharacterized protein LOC110543558 isoform X3 [Meriones unguiculatus]